MPQDDSTLSSNVVPEFPLEDPVTDLPETAERILEAARRLLLRGGFEALRWDAIAAEAGRNKSAIKYYFGNKKGLILALVDSLDYEECLAFAEETRERAARSASIATSPARDAWPATPRGSSSSTTSTHTSCATTSCGPASPPSTTGTTR